MVKYKSVCYFESGLAVAVIELLQLGFAVV